MAGRPVRESRLKSLNPVFHFRDENEDSEQLSTAMIKQARRSGILNLSNRGLGTVPERVWNIHEPDAEEVSKALDLNRKQEDEDDGWWNHTFLSNLDLSSNSLAKISGSIKNLHDLTVLNLHDNALTVLPTEIGCLDKLVKLNLSHNKLTSLPKEFFQLKELQQLNVAYNKFDELSRDIADLFMLEVLDISHNELRTLPDGIGFLVRLTQLTVSFNRLTELPNDIVNLRMLNKLEIMNNDLKTLPPAMGELRRLECLYVQHNDIVELPDFTGCEGLKEIHISNNFITEIPNEFCESLPQLKVLDLRDNKIEKLPEQIAYLQSLMRLDLSNNSLNSIPNSLSTLAHLVSLQLNGNPIRSIRRDVLQCGTSRILKTLRDRSTNEGGHPEQPIPPTIGGNDSDEFPDVYKMKKTRSLGLGLKNLTDVPDAVFIDAAEAHVSSVDLSKNQLTIVPVGLGQLTGLLHELNLSSNNLSTLPEFISQFEHIQFMNLSKNNFTELPGEFGLLNTLRELNIANNRFTKIPSCVYELKALEVLLASDNQIKEIDASGDGLAALTNLSTLDLSNNNVGQVPPILGKLKNITTLQLSGNSFRQPRHQIIAKGTEAIMSYLRDRIPN